MAALAACLAKAATAPRTEPMANSLIERMGARPFTVDTAGRIHFASDAMDEDGGRSWADIVSRSARAAFETAWDQYRGCPSTTVFEQVVDCHQPDGRAGPSLIRVCRACGSAAPFAGIIVALPVPPPHREADADSLARLRSQFLACISHEFRTPLNAIIGFSELITSGADTLRLQQIVEFSHDIHAASLRLLDLVNNIIDTAHIAGDRRELSLSQLDAATVVRRAVQLAATAHATRHIRFDIAAEAGLMLWADRRALAQIVLQIADNAAKHSPKGGRVGVRLWRQGDGVRLEIADNGPGFPPEVLERIGQAFLRADAYSGSEPGLGLGLHLACSLARMHGGALTAENRSIGGARIAVWLPSPSLTA